MKHRRAFSFIFLIIIFTPALLRLAGVRARAFENRRLTDAPKITLKTFFQLKTYKKLNQHLRDEMPGRDWLVRLNSGFNYFVFQDPPNGRILRGPADIHFSRVALTRPCREGYKLTFHESIDLMARLQDLYPAGKEFAYVIAPNKSAIIPGELPEAGRKMGICPERQREWLRARLKNSEKNTVKTLTFWDEFENYQKRKKKPDALFPPFDRHWNHRAGYLFGSQFIRKLSPSVWAADSGQVSWRPWKKRGELARKLANLILWQPTEKFEYERPGVEVKKIHKLTIPPGLVFHCDRRIRGRVPKKDRCDYYEARPLNKETPVVPGLTVILHDSFLNRSIPIINRFFEKLVLIKWSNWERVNTVRFARLMGEADRLLVSFVEDWRNGRLRQLDKLLENPKVRRALAGRL